MRKLFYVLLALLVFSLYWDFSKSSKVETASKKRFELQAKEAIDDYNYMVAICDTATGNLVYTNNDRRGGMAVVINGCQKNTR